MIDYSLLHESTLYYASHGFQRIESPWAVSEYADNITKPKSAQPFIIEHNKKHLVASGEQSFLYLYLKGFLPKGQFQTITPCFRFESFDSLHTKYFMKNELIKTDNVSEKELEIMVGIALMFFKPMFPDAKVVPTEIGYDIEVNGIELGSYGIRKCDFLEWIYGTACAEPRTSMARSMYGRIS